MYVLSFYSLRSSKISFFWRRVEPKTIKIVLSTVEERTAQNYFDFLCVIFSRQQVHEIFMPKNKRENSIFRVWEIFPALVVVVCVVLDSPNISPDFYSISMAFNPRELFCMVENYAFSRLINHKQQKRATSLNQSVAMRKNFHFSQ
jgi:hypothetical protein